MANRDLVLGSGQKLPVGQKQEYGFFHNHDFILNQNHDLGPGNGLDIEGNDDIGLGVEDGEEHDLGTARDETHQVTIRQIDENEARPVRQHRPDLDRYDNIGSGLDLGGNDDIGLGAEDGEEHDLGTARDETDRLTIRQIDENEARPLRQHRPDLYQEDGYSNEDEDEVNIDASDQVVDNENVDDLDNRFDGPNETHKLYLSVNQDFNGTLDLHADRTPEAATVTTAEYGMQGTDLMYSSPSVVQSRSLVPIPTHDLHVGQEFPDVQSCRRALRDAAIALHFEIQTVKSDKTRFTAKCASEGCPWRIHAAKLPGVPKFTIRTLNNQHTCDGLTHLGHQQATVQWVANSVEQRLRENPNYKPKEILEEIHRVHGIALSYKQAWRGKERILAAVRGSFEEGYRLLPQYTEQIQKTNPGSIAAVYGNPQDNCFQRLFVSYQASIYGFLNGCRPLLGLDRIALKSKYLGTLLLATGFDGDGDLFPLAFGVVDEETDDSWMWFLTELHHLLELNTENMPRLTILSDRNKGIVDGVDINFPTAFHGFCMRHLSENFRKEFNNTLLVNLLWEAAHALTVIEYEAKLLEIEEISPEAAYWIRRLPPRLWATAYFEGTRFGHLTANIYESINAWISEASGLPIIQMMESIRRQLMTWFNERREASMEWTSTLVPNAEKQVEDAIEHARGFQVLRANEAEFEVISPDMTHIVDIRNRCCLCHGWQAYGLPCSHAVAALISCRQTVQRFTESCFTVAAYRKAYSQTIHPIPDKTMWNEGNGNSTPEVVMNPPKSLRPPPRPRKKRSRPDDRGPVKRVVHCSRCNQTGHFRTTCAAPI